MDETCTLLADDYRPFACQTWPGPSSAGGEHIFACGGVFGDEYQTCDDILDEDCTMSSTPDINTGDSNDPFECADLCRPLSK